MGLADDARGWWGSQCPARQSGLSHAHDSRCPDGHAMAQCCECGGVYEKWELADHLYHPTVVGVCLRCKKPIQFHPAIVSARAEDQPPPVVQYRDVPDANDCTVDHTSISTKHLIGDGGMVWTTCPMCGLHVEPKLATGDTVGPRYGLGRMPVTQRMQNRWNALRGAWRAGYYES